MPTTNCLLQVDIAEESSHLERVHKEVRYLTSLVPMGVDPIHTARRSYTRVVEDVASWEVTGIMIIRKVRNEISTFNMDRDIASGNCKVVESLGEEYTLPVRSDNCSWGEKNRKTHDEYVGSAREYFFTFLNGQERKSIFRT